MKFAQYYVKTRVKGPLPPGSLAKARLVWGPWRTEATFSLEEDAIDHLTTIKCRLRHEHAVFYLGVKVAVLRYFEGETGGL